MEWGTKMNASITNLFSCLDKVNYLLPCTIKKVYLLLHKFLIKKGEEYGRIKH